MYQDKDCSSFHTGGLIMRKAITALTLVSVLTCHAEQPSDPQNLPTTTKAANKELNAAYYREFGWRLKSFDRAPCYPTAQNAFLAHARFAPGTTVLDIGTGPGHFSNWMQEQGYSVTCVEADKTLAAYCNEIMPCTQVDIDAYTPAIPFDVVVGICWPFSHIDPIDAPKVIEAISRTMLKKGGICILAIFHGVGSTYEDPMSTGRKRCYHHYTEDKWRKMIAPYFETVSVTKHFTNSIKKDVGIWVLRNKKG